MILIIDNYDSFTYNLVHSIEQEEEICVLRNDKAGPMEIAEYNPRVIIISPGPGRPEDAGYSEAFVDYYKDKVPILGICLGHQAICEAYGAKIHHAAQIVHGKPDTITIKNKDPIFEGLSSPFTAGRYHSLSVDKETLPEELLVLAESSDGEVMAVKDKSNAVYGLQFHPESILTPDGKKIIENFLKQNDTTSDK